MSTKMTIIEGNSSDKDNVRVLMVKGETGNSPTLNVLSNENIVTITATDDEGTTSATLESPTVETSKTGGVTTITITDMNGVHTATINDGDVTYDNTFCTFVFGTISVPSGETVTSSIALPAGFSVGNTCCISCDLSGDGIDGYQTFAEGSLNTSNIEKQAYLYNDGSGSKFYLKLKNIGIATNVLSARIVLMKVRSWV